MIVGINSFTLSQGSRILRELDLEFESPATLKQLKRSFARLADLKITFRTAHAEPKEKSEASMWIGAFLQNVMYDGSTKSRKVIIKFNEAMAPSYEKKSLVLLPLDSLNIAADAGKFIERALQTDQPLQETAADFAKLVIQAAMARHARLGELADALGIGRSTLDDKRKKHGI